MRENKMATNQSAEVSIALQAQEPGIRSPQAIIDEASAIANAQQERLWILENAQALAEMNDFIENSGLPLARYRQF